GAFLDGRADLLEKVARDVGDLGDRGFEGLAVARGRGSVPADLADELACGRLDLTGRRRLVRPAKDLDAATHERRVPPSVDAVGRALGQLPGQRARVAMTQRQGK